MKLTVFHGFFARKTSFLPSISVWVGLLLFSGVAHGLDFSSLNNPTAERCRVSLTTVKNRIENSNLSSAEKTEAVALAKLIELIGLHRASDEVVQHMLGVAGYGDLFLGRENSIAQGRRLSSSLRRYFGFFDGADRARIEMFHDQILVPADPTLTHLNLFSSKGLSEFIALADKIPVDSEGRVLHPGTLEYYHRYLELLNAYLGTITFSFRDALVATEEKGKMLTEYLKEFPQDAEKTKREIKLLISSIDELQSDFQTTLKRLFEDTPSADFITKERFVKRFAQSNLLLGTVGAFAKSQMDELNALINDQRPSDRPEPASARPNSSSNVPPQARTLSDIQGIFGAPETQEGLRRSLIPRLKNYFPAEGGIYGAYTANQDVQLGLLYLTRGLMKEGNALLKSGLDKISDLTIRKAIHSGVAAASKDQDLAWMLVRIHYGDRQVGYPLETIMVHHLANAGPRTVDFGQFNVPFMNFRMPQVAAARVLLRYGNLSSTSRILEVGYGTPSILAGLKPYLSEGKVVGIDVLAPPTGYEEDAVGVTLLFGNAPLETGAAAQVKANGPFSAIYGVDVFKHDVGFGQRFAPGISNGSYLKWVYDNLEEGGVFIAMNDYLSPLVFTEAELAAANLQKVREEVYEVTGAERTLISDSNPLAGKMTIFIYRRGTYDPAKLGRVVNAGG